MKYLFAAVYALFNISLISPAAAEVVLRSGPEQMAVVELYTSEGCSSCPPAEAFMNELVSDPRLWRGVVPVVFHVDYWDYLGWKDPYASPAHSQRQRDYGDLLNASTIYTPEFFINGKEWRPRFRRNLPEPQPRHVGELTVTVSGDQLTAQFDPAVAVAGALTLNVARLGMGLTTDIRAGENKGRQARHEFVVLSFVQHDSRQNSWAVAVPPPRKAIAADQQNALAAWITESNNPVPIQAVAGFLDESAEAQKAHDLSN